MNPAGKLRSQVKQQLLEKPISAPAKKEESKAPAVSVPKKNFSLFEDDGDPLDFLLPAAKKTSPLAPVASVSSKVASATLPVAKPYVATSKSALFADDDDDDSSDDDSSLFGAAPSVSSKASPLAAVASVSTKVASATPFPAPVASSKPVSAIALTKEQCDALTTKASAGDAEALHALRTHAEAGNAYAQYDLGWRYRNGVGVTRDWRVAHHWFKAAADQGDPNAKHYLKELESDITRDLYDKAQAGDADALRKLRTQAEARDADAQFWMGHLYYHGHGGVKSIDIARQWYESADRLGNIFAKGQLHHMKVIEETSPETIRKLKAQAEAGEAAAQYELVRLQAHYSSSTVKIDRDEARRWHRAAADQGYVHAQWYFGHLYRYGCYDLYKDERRAFIWYLMVPRRDILTHNSMLEKCVKTAKA